MDVTTHPTAEWTARQIVQAFPLDTAPRFIIRDRDGIYGDVVRRAIELPERGQVLRRPMVGGLHSRYDRDAA